MSNRHDYVNEPLKVSLPSDTPTIPTAVSRLIHRIQKGKSLSADYRFTLNAIAKATKRTPEETITWIKSWSPTDRRQFLASIAEAMK